MSPDEDDHRVKPLSRVETTRAEWGGGLRIWEASKPLIDTTEEPDHGTTGFHLHTYASKAERKVGKKVIDDTFETIILDGVEVQADKVTIADRLAQALLGILAITDRKHVAWDAAHAALHEWGPDPKLLAEWKRGSS